MPPSYRFIDYRVRPAKHIERKMLLETFTRLHPFAPIDRYQYIGFGAIYFADFALFHRALGIEQMISIEHHLPDEERIRFNAPFDCIDVHMGESNDILPNLDWEAPAIVWLDYDGRLDTDGITDIATFLRKASLGSVLIASCNARIDLGDHEEGDAEGAVGAYDPADVLRARVGATFVPPDVRREDLSGWGTARVTKRIFANVVAETLNSVNGSRDPSNPLIFHHLLNFQYEDDAKMITVGGVLLDQASSATFAACEFDKLSFYRPADDPYRIATPRLTLRELRHLDTQLPCLDANALAAPGVPPGDISKYAQVYRYFPLFAEALI